MKNQSLRLASLLALVTLFAPFTSVRSQLAPLPNDPGAILQALEQANVELLKRQETTLKELEDLTNQARETRLFARKG